MKSWNCTILDSFFWEPAEDSQEVDVSFVPMMLRRRCSQFTKLCFSASHQSITEGKDLPVISVSKYGEIQRQYAISKKIIETKEVSPTAFSFSVFNTAIALLGISLKNHASAQAFSTMSYQLEAGLIHALSFLENHSEEEKLLLLVGEERLPEAYQNISAEKNIPFIAAFLLSLHGNGYTVRFSSMPPQDRCSSDVYNNDNALADNTGVIENSDSPENYDQCKRFIRFVQSPAGTPTSIHINRLEIFKNE
ncbi:hypothetical protein DWB79_03590 [Treponema medium]|uniref:Beta-ketoacyl synthase-like N-terminal domain-containing protein n=2 Tax=Treponema medium TaxID=58231 RepID=A0AA87NMV1_TREMD|nr:beta-ketoacyl synthase chain length factor [Treponema medium]EPF29423.1 hypothetical protein HMPREF9195_00709 [Treponema medium ATCC 700293]QSH96856.1 hypothetical protein DWB79_03590 [Treponema medium]